MQRGRKVVIVNCQAILPIQEAMVVGDTLADVKMGRSAELGMTIGVLSGVAASEELHPYTDHMLEDVGQLPALISSVNSKANVEDLKHEESPFSDMPIASYA